MRKSVGIIAAVVVIGAAYTGTSWYVGQRAQTTIEQAVEQANQQLADVFGPDLDRHGLKVAISQYQRHVFSSDVIYTVQMNGADGQPVEYLLSDHLQHGPFPVAALKSGDMVPMLALSQAQLIPSAVTQAWFDSLDGDSPMQGITRIGLSGNGRSEWQFKPLDVVQGDESLKFSGGTVHATFDGSFKNSMASGQFAAIDYVATGDDDKIQVKAITFNSATTGTGEPSATQVKSTVSADSVLISSGDSEPLLLEKIAFNLDSNQQGDLLDGTLRYDFGRVVLGEADLGGVSMGVKAKSLDVQALSALALEYDRVKGEHDAASRENLQLSGAQAKALRDKLWAFLASNPTLALDPFVWKNDQGQSSMSLVVNLSRPAEESVDGPPDVQLLQPVKRLQLDVFITKPMLVKAFGQLQSGPVGEQEAAAAGARLFDQYTTRLAAAGLVKKDEDNVTTAITYEDNSVVVNGAKMSIPELGQRVISAVM